MRKVDMQMRQDRCYVVYSILYLLFIYLSIYFVVIVFVIYLIFNKWKHLAAHSLV